MNEQFQTDLNRFFDKVEDRLEYIVFGTAKELHSRLVEITPYRTGRARASWNISAFVSDDVPAPDIGFGGIDASNKDLASANVFYDSLIAAKARFVRVSGALVMHVTNTLFYIEKLNAGSSAQAPAGFFQATVFSAGQIVNRVMRGIT